MKRAAELEQELVEMGQKMAAISKAICSLNYEHYMEHEEFCVLIKAYKGVYDQMYLQSERENYYWRFCPLRVYHHTYEARLAQCVDSSDGEMDEEDFLAEERNRSYDYDSYAPILLERGYPLPKEKYYVHLDFVYEYFFKAKSFRKQFTQDREEKEMFCEMKSDALQRRNEQDLNKRKLNVAQILGLDDEIDDYEEETGVSQSYSEQDRIIEQRFLTDLEKATRWLSAFKGLWLNGKPMMSVEDYHELHKEVKEMIMQGGLPEVIHPVKKIPASNQFIKRVFWEIHNELYTMRHTKDYFIEYLLKKFVQLEQNEFRTLKNKFKYYEGDFESDFNQISEV